MSQLCCATSFFGFGSQCSFMPLSWFKMLTTLLLLLLQWMCSEKLPVSGISVYSSGSAIACYEIALAVKYDLNSYQAVQHSLSDLCFIPLQHVLLLCHLAGLLHHTAIMLLQTFHVWKKRNFDTLWLQNSSRGF
jgi:hypothetical protein